MLQYILWVIRSLRKDLGLRNFYGIGQKILVQLRSGFSNLKFLIGWKPAQLKSVTIAANLSEQNLAFATRAAEARSVQLTYKPAADSAPVVAEYVVALAWFIKLRRTDVLLVSETQGGYEVSISKSQTLGRLRLKQHTALSRFALPKSGRTEHVVFQRDNLALRELARIGLINFSNYLEHYASRAMHPQRPIVMYLPEIGLRNPELGDEMFVPFAGVTNQQGWLGCAHSQVALAEIGLKQALASITVIEDDAVLTSDWQKRWETGRKLVEAGELDAASGLVIEMPSLPKSWRVREVGGTSFFVSNVFSSNLFATLSPSAMIWISGFPDTAADPNTEAIDCFIQSKDGLRNGVFVPFLATPMPDARSTLWGFGNRTYQGQIELARTLILSAQQESLGGKLV